MFALILGVFILTSVRIVELGLLGIYDYVVLGEFPEIDLRSVDFEFCDVGLRRDIALDYVRLSRSRNCIYLRYGNSVTVSIFEVFVNPSIGNLLLVYLSCGEISLRDVSVYCVSVDIHVVESVVLTDTLSLVVEILNRLVVVDSDVADSLFVASDGLGIERIICFICGNPYIIYAVSVPRVLDIALEVLGLFVDFVRAYDESLYCFARCISEHEYEHHDYRNLEKLRNFTLLYMYGKCHRTYERKQHDYAVKPERYVYIYKARAVYSACMRMQQVELFKEEVRTEHEIENNAEDYEFAARNFHQVIEVAVVDIHVAAFGFFMVFIEGCLDCILGRSSHSSDYGVVDRRAVDNLRL